MLITLYYHQTDFVNGPDQYPIKNVLAFTAIISIMPLKIQTI